MTERRHVRKTSRYAPYVASTPRSPYEHNNRDEFDSLESELVREYELVTESVPDCDETTLSEAASSSTINTARFSQMSENSGENTIDSPVSSSSSSPSSAMQQQRSSTTTDQSKSSNQGEIVVPQLEDWNEYVDDEAYVSDIDVSNVFDDSSNASDVEPRHREYDVIDSQSRTNNKRQYVIQ